MREILSYPFNAHRRAVSFSRLWAIPTLVAASFITFWLCHHVPGSHSDTLDPARFLVDKPKLLASYRVWFSAFMVGDWGTSLHWEQPALPLVLHSLLITICIAFLAAAQVLAIALASGWITTREWFSPYRSLANSLLAACSTLPTYLWLLLLLATTGSLWLQLPDTGWTGLVFKAVIASHFVALGSFAGFTLLWCNAVRRYHQQTFAMAATAQGVSPLRLYLRHTLVFCWRECSENLYQLGFAFCSGSLFVEVALSIPGLGRLAWDSWRYRDTPIVMASCVCFTLLYFALDADRR